MPISVSVSRLPRKRPCGTRLELFKFYIQPGERAELIAATVTRDGSRSEPLSPVAVEATAAKSIKKAIGMLISVRSGRKFKSRDHLERIMMRTALTKSVFYRAQRGFRKILRELIVRVHSRAGVYAVATASAATRASRPRWIDCACAQGVQL